jgi:CRP/FNR family transcriptional regulator, cyclic AMP receptor protein
MTTLAGKMMLQRSPLFRGLPAASLDRIVGLATQRSFRAGEIVFSQGDPGDALYAVVSGRIRISSGTAEGREISLNIMEPGETLGEIALLDGGTRTATATATEPSELVSIRRDHFVALLEREPRVALELLKLCGERLRWTSGLVEDAALLDAPARLAKRLLSLGELHGRRSNSGITLKISQEDLATFLGVSRQVVNQYLQGWKARGWVALGRGAVTVRDPDALRHAARSTAGTGAPGRS